MSLGEIGQILIIAAVTLLIVVGILFIALEIYLGCQLDERAEHIHGAAP